MADPLMDARLADAEQRAQRTLRTTVETLNALEVAVRAVAEALADLAHGQKPSPITISDQRAVCRRVLAEIEERRAELSTWLEKCHG